MIDVEPLLVPALERLIPVPAGERADWGDVVERAGLPSRRRRRTTVAVAGLAAAVLVVLSTPVGAAIAERVGDFSAWLTGQPGKEAPAAEQRTFDSTNARSWASFPRETQLRELIRADVADKSFVLSGFRSGTFLCLQLTGPGRRERLRAPAYVSASTLARSSAPILVVTGNGGFYDQYAHRSAAFSFGIVADGVKRVDVHTNQGRYRARVGGNAYLWIEGEPNTGTSVKRISATAAAGRRTSVPVVAPGPRLGPWSLTGTHGGPTRVQARIARPTIGWYVRGEQRGLSASEAHLTREQRQQVRSCCHARLFKPDPLSNIVVGLEDEWCMVVIDGGGSCGDREHFFSRGPFNFMIFGGGFNSSDQFAGVAGAAADGVKRITIFLGGGERQAVPVEDNMFAALVPAHFPMRLVAYDSKGRVVGLQSFPGRSFIRQMAVPPGARNLRPVQRATGPNGTTATVSAGPAVDRRRCWRIKYSTGHTDGGCELTFYTGPKIRVSFVQRAGDDLFVVGSADGQVTDHIELHFENGDVISTRPVADQFVFAIPCEHLSPERQFGYVVAIGRHGHRVQRQGIAFRIG